MGEKKKKGKKKNRTSGNRRKDEWVGKHKVLVNTAFGPLAAKYFVVDLKKNIIEMQHPFRLWSDTPLGSVAVVLENTIMAYQIGGCPEEGMFKATKGDSIDDHIHSFSGTSKSLLNLETDPPKWSKWEDCEAEVSNSPCFPICVAHGKKIFAFGHTPMGQVYDTNKFDCTKWEDLPKPFGPPYVNTITNVFSDLKNNRLILYFDHASCLYAYYPDKDEESRWECLNSNIKTYLGLTGQVFDDVIYLFHAPYTIHAYDVRQRIWLNVSWSRKELENSNIYFNELSTMIHLGDGMMCLAVHYDVRQPDYQPLQMFRFSVERRSDKDVQLHPVSRHSVDPGRCHSMFSYTPF